jgi:hypothetical protein
VGFTAHPFSSSLSDGYLTRSVSRDLTSPSEPGSPSSSNYRSPLSEALDVHRSTASYADSTIRRRQPGVGGYSHIHPIGLEATTSEEMGAVGQQRSGNGSVQHGEKDSPRAMSRPLAIPPRPRYRRVDGAGL